MERANHGNNGSRDAGLVPAFGDHVGGLTGLDELSVLDVSGVMIGLSSTPQQNVVLLDRVDHLIGFGYDERFGVLQSDFGELIHIGKELIQIVGDS